MGSNDAVPPTGGGHPRDAHPDSRIGDRDLTRWPTAPGRAVAAQVTRTSTRLGPQRTLILILAIGLAVAVLLAFAASRVYDAVTETDGVASLDRPILDAAATFRSPALDAFAAAVAYLLGPVGMPIIALVCCIALALVRRSVTPVTLVVAGGLGSLLMTLAGKDIIGRSRPPLTDAIAPFEHSASFPSGHTLNATVILGVLAYLLILRRDSAAARVAIGAATVIAAIVVGLTRVLLGAHWFTDVLAAWLLGAAWLALIITAHRLYLTAWGRAREARRRQRTQDGTGSAPSAG